MRNKLIDATKYLPRHKQAKKKLAPPDGEPGLPSIHSVKADSMPRVGKSQQFSQMREEPMKSLSLAQKIDASLGPLAMSVRMDDDVSIALAEMMDTASSPERFDSQSQFKRFLTEGAMINVNRVVSTTLGIPQGEYVVYSINSKKSMLVPTAEVTMQETDFSKQLSSYEVFTPRLYGCWDKAEKTIFEIAAADDNSSGDNSGQPSGPPIVRGRKERKGLHASNSKYPRRSQFKSSIETFGGSQEDLAASLGVDPSTVSRWGANDFSGQEPGGRNPSLSHAVELAGALGSDVEDMFPNVPKSKRRSSTAGSGGGRNELFKRGEE